MSSFLNARRIKEKRGHHLCLFFHQRFRSDPTHKNKQRTSTPICTCVRRHIIYTYQRTSIALLVLGVWNFPDLWWPKQALINAFKICPQSQLLNFALQRYYIFLNCAKDLKKKSCKSFLGLLSVIGRCIREGKETAILRKRTFLLLEFFRGSLVLLWFILGLLQRIVRQGTAEGNLKNRTVC